MIDRRRHFGIFCSVAPTLVALALATAATSRGATSEPSAIAWGQRGSLPLPGSMAAADYERRLFEFLNREQYKKLGWLRDKRVRDTGPYLNGVYYGTHLAVRIYYSPE